MSRANLRCRRAGRGAERSGKFFSTGVVFVRYEIATAPKNGAFVILEDDECGKYDVAQWSDGQGNWIGREAEPIKILPTHWHPLPRDDYFREEDSEAADNPNARSSFWRLRYFILSGVCVAGAVLLLDVMGDSARPELTLSATQQGSTDTPPARQQANDNTFPAAMQPKVELRPLIDADEPEPQQRVQARVESPRAAGIAAGERAEPAALPEESSPEAVQHSQPSRESSAQQTASAEEMAVAQREIVALEQRLRDAARQIGQFRDAGRMLTELQQSLQLERHRAALMMREMEAVSLAGCALDSALQCRTYR